jgi:hypothetical protein
MLPHRNKEYMNMFESKLSKSELTARTILWCREIGIKPRDLGCSTAMTEDGKLRPYQNAHPAIDDVIILIQMRNEFWTYWNKSEQASWAAHWSSVYHKGHHFKAKALKNIERLANTGIFRQQEQEQQRQTIQQLRESKYKNGDVI